MEMIHLLYHLQMSQSNSIRSKAGFAIASNTVLRNPEISLGEKALYCYLCSFADEDDTTFVSVNRMATENGIGYSTALRYLRQLEDKQIISRRQRAYGRSTVTKILM
mgnify:CR=1 FL=1